MKTLSFFAAGIPKGQPRPRACIRGRHAGMYDPGTANEWKDAIKSAALNKWDNVPFDCAVFVDVVLYFPRPKGHFHRNGELRDGTPSWHVAKPDRDNCDKAILDALTDAGILADDSIVCTGQIVKRYAAQHEATGAHITVGTVD